VEIDKTHPKIPLTNKCRFGGHFDHPPNQKIFIKFLPGLWQAENIYKRKARRI
jgi:hypothetical protein